MLCRFVVLLLLGIVHFAFFAEALLLGNSTEEGLLDRCRNALATTHRASWNGETMGEGTSTAPPYRYPRVQYSFSVKRDDRQFCIEGKSEYPDEGHSVTQKAKK